MSVHTVCRQDLVCEIIVSEITAHCTHIHTGTPNVLTLVLHSLHDTPLVLLSNPWLDLWWQGVVHSLCEVALLHTNTHPHRVPYLSTRNYTCANIHNTHACTCIYRTKGMQEVLGNTFKCVLWEVRERREWLHYTIVYCILRRAL